MKHIFHILSKCDLGGAEQVVAYLASSGKDDFQYHVCEVFHTYTAYSEVFVERLRQQNVQVHLSPIKQKKWAILLFPFYLFRLAKRYRPSVIHTHTEIPDLSVYIFYYLLSGFLPFKIKYVRTIHNTVLWNSWKRIGRMVEHFYNRKATNVAISENVRKNYIRLYGEERPVPLIPNGVPPASSPEEFPFLIKGKINVLFAGRFEYQKGIDTLVQVVNALETNEKYYFHLIGDGPLKEKMSVSLNGSNNKMYGPVFGLSRYLSSFDFLFMPSLFEGQSMLAIESCMNKTPLIANACEGIVDVVPPGWELLVKDNSLAGYRMVFERLLSELDYTSLTEKAFAYAQERFSLEQMRKKYEALYDSF